MDVEAKSDLHFILSFVPLRRIEDVILGEENTADTANGAPAFEPVNFVQFRSSFSNSGLASSRGRTSGRGEEAGAVRRQVQASG